MENLPGDVRVSTDRYLINGANGTRELFAREASALGQPRMLTVAMGRHRRAWRRARLAHRAFGLNALNAIDAAFAGT
jgi:hypothetical protein